MNKGRLEAFSDTENSTSQSVFVKSVCSLIGVRYGEGSTLNLTLP